LIGELYFPNIFLEKNEIDFGCILNNTEQVKYIQMTNISPLIVNYKWKFLLEKDNVVSNMIMETNLSDEEAKLEKIVEYNNNIKENVNQNNDNIEEAVIENDLENAEQKNSNQNNEDVVVYQNEEMSSLDNENNDVKVEKPGVNQKTYKIKEILQRNNNEIDLPSIEEIFDISPLYGSLHPGESQKLKITYFGHKEIKSFVKAICEVKNGPEYELMLKGEASVLNYELSDRMIDLGYVIYDEISEAYINIKNLGKVAIEFSMIGADEDSTLIEPDKPVIIPSKGLVDADKIETITIKYLPGLPQKFTKKIQLQVSHFAPEEITIKGEAGFADIMLDLPRFENDAYKYLKKEAKNIVKIKEEMQQKTDSDIPIYQSLSIAPELDLQIEVDRLAIQDFITKKIATRNNSAICNYHNRTSALSKLKVMTSQKNNNAESIDDTKNGFVFSSNNNHINLNIQTSPSNNFMINSPKPEKGVASPSNRTADTYKSLTKKSDK
jgi:hydrocephalus-inducing protein